MAPEQAQGKVHEVGPATDIYSLGALLYECLTGRPPFRADSVINTLMQVMHGEAEPPSQLTPGLPAALDAICLKCLEKAPQRRYATAEALADDLRRYQDGEPITASASKRRAWSGEPARKASRKKGWWPFG
jgi:serine/threonine protein kinase